MKKFEYKTIGYNNFQSAENELNRLGEEGWELVSVVINSAGNYVAFLKKQVDEAYV